MRKFLYFCLLLFFFNLLPSPLFGRPVPRSVVGLYSSSQERELEETKIHKYLQMALNHLGLTVNYWDIDRGLPPQSVTSTCRGILSWWESPPPIDKKAYSHWLVSQAKKGKRGG